MGAPPGRPRTRGPDARRLCAREELASPLVVALALVLAVPVLATRAAPPAGATPAAPGTISRYGGTPGAGPLSSVVVDSSHDAVAHDGTVYLADRTFHVVRAFDPDTGEITVVAGTGEARSHGDGGPATEAGLHNPFALAVESDGSLLVAEQGAYGGSQRIRRIDAGTGLITTVAGGGNPAIEEGRPAVAVQLWNFSGPLAVGPDDAVYFAVDWPRGIWRIDPGSGLLEHVTGSGYCDNCPAPAEGLFARDVDTNFNSGFGVEADGDIVFADSRWPQRIWRVDATTDELTLVAGGGGATQDGAFATETAVSTSRLLVAPDGGILYSPWGQIRRIDPHDHTVTTVATTIDNPLYAIDIDSSVYVLGNGPWRRIAPGTYTAELLGSPASTYPDTTPIGETQFYDVSEATTLPNGDVVFATSIPNHWQRTVRLLDATTGTVRTLATAGNPQLAATADGRVALADYWSLRIIDPADLTETTFDLDFSVNDLAVHADGDLVVSTDSDNEPRLVRVALDDGTATPFVGPGDHPGSHTGDGGPAVDASIYWQSRIATRPDGTVAINSDGRVRLVGIDGTIQTVAGAGDRWIPGADGAPGSTVGWFPPDSFVADGTRLLGSDHGSAPAVWAFDVATGMTRRFVGGGNAAPDEVAPRDARLDQIDAVTQIGTDGDLLLFSGGRAYRITAPVPFDQSVVTDVRIRGVLVGEPDLGATLSTAITITNVGGWLADAPVVLMFAVPAWLAFDAMQSPGWACGAPGPSVTCTRNEPLPAGEAPPVVATFEAVATADPGAPLTASIATQTPDPNPADNTAAIPLSTHVLQLASAPATMFDDWNERRDHLRFSDHTPLGATLATPTAFHFDADGSVIYADWDDSAAPRVRRVTPDGQVETLAGFFDGTFDDGPARLAQVDLVFGLDRLPDGRLLLAELGLFSGSPRVRAITADGQLVTVLGGGAEDPAAGGAGTDAALGLPAGLAVGPDGAVYVTDLATHTVIRWDPVADATSVVAGTGTGGVAGDDIAATDAQLLVPSSVAFDSTGAMYVNELGAARIRKVVNGVITTVAGAPLVYESSGDNGPAADAHLLAPLGIAIGPDDAVYVVESLMGLNFLGLFGLFDEKDDDFDWEAFAPRVRRIDADGRITTVAAGGSVSEVVPPTPGGPAIGPTLLGLMAVGVDLHGVVNVGAFRFEHGEDEGWYRVVAPGPDLSLHSRLASPPAVGRSVSVQVTVANAGMRASGPVTIAIEHDPALEVLAASGPGIACTIDEESDDETTCTITGGLAVDAEATVTLLVRAETKAALRAPLVARASTAREMNPFDNGTSVGFASHTARAYHELNNGFVVGVLDDGRVVEFDSNEYTLVATDPETLDRTTIVGGGSRTCYDAPDDSGDPFATALCWVAAITVVDGTVYFTDRVNGEDIAVLALDLDTATLHVLGTIPSAHTADRLAIDEGTVYVGYTDADEYTGRIARIDDGTVTVIAGLGSDSDGEGIPALDALVPYEAYGLAVLPNGDVLYAEVYAARVRRIDAATGTVTTIAGGGGTPAAPGVLAADAQLGLVGGIAVLPDGSILVTEPLAGRVWSIDPTTGELDLYAGGGTTTPDATPIPADQAALGLPITLVTTGTDVVYVADVATGILFEIRPHAVEPEPEPEPPTPPAPPPTTTPPTTPPPTTAPSPTPVVAPPHPTVPRPIFGGPRGPIADHPTAPPRPDGARLVGIAGPPDGRGTWTVDAAGGVYTDGDVPFFGSLGATPLISPIEGIAATPHGAGYWLVAADGGVFTFGDAAFHGSLGGLALNAPIVDLIPTPSGRGYWLVAADGGVFTFGDATFFGSLAGLPLNAPIVDAAATPSGRGYWLIGADGGLFTFGDAEWFPPPPDQPTIGAYFPSR